VHYEIPDTVDRQPYDVPADDFDWKQEEMNLLQKKGAFSLPPLHVQKALLDAYFRWVFPMQQILDREQFLRDFEAGRASVLLLQALFFVGTTCCDEDIIRGHWGTRRSAQVTLYRRVKALYDADYEQNQITVIQVLFSMTSWWEVPRTRKTSVTGWRPQSGLPKSTGCIDRKCRSFSRRLACAEQTLLGQNILTCQQSTENCGSGFGGLSMQVSVDPTAGFMLTDAGTRPL
jgi:hypothetical protein